MGRPKHALNVSEAERDQIRELFARGVRVADIARRVKRGEWIVQRTVRGLKRPKPTSRRNTERDARMVRMHAEGSTFRELGIEFGISATRACVIVSVLTGRRPPRSRVRTAMPKLASSPGREANLTPAQRARRNATIERLWREGVTYAQLGRRFMLSRHQIRKIVATRLRRRGESLPPRKRKLGAPAPTPGSSR